MVSPKPRVRWSRSPKRRSASARDTNGTSTATSNFSPRSSTLQEVSRTLTRTTYGQQGGPGEVTLWTSQDAGHTWPGGRMSLLHRAILGRASKEIDASREIRSFQQAHATDA